MTLTQDRSRRTDTRAPLDPAALRQLLDAYAREHDGALPLAPAQPTARSYDLLELTDQLEVWAIHWPTGQGLELHDHGGSAGALVVVEGTLTEQVPAGDGRLVRRTLAAGQGSAFGPRHIHDVVNHAAAPATSLHAYSPPMASMTFYRTQGPRLLPSRTEFRADPSWAP